MRLIATIAVSLLAGCATTPPTEDSPPPPSDSIFRSDLIAGQSRDQAKVLMIVQRDSGLMVGACAFDFHVEGNRWAQFRPGEQLRFEVPPGRYQIHFQYGGILCPPYASAGYLVEATAGETVRVRMGVASMLAFMQVKKEP